MELNVIKTHHIDKGEKDDNGLYDYYYEYDVYVFSRDGYSLRVRSYFETPSEASLLVIFEDGVERFLTQEDLKSSFIKDAIEYLKQDGKNKFDWLDTSNKDAGYTFIQ